jgi:hypothetical protein
LPRSAGRSRELTRDGIIPCARSMEPPSPNAEPRICHSVASRSLIAAQSVEVMNVGSGPVIVGFVHSTPRLWKERDVLGFDLLCRTASFGMSLTARDVRRPAFECQLPPGDGFRIGPGGIVLGGPREGDAGAVAVGLRAQILRTPTTLEVDIYDECSRL